MRTDPTVYDWTYAFVRGLGDATRSRSAGRDGEQFSAFMVPVLLAVMAAAAEAPIGPYGGRQIGMRTLGQQLGLGRCVVRRYLLAAARAGLFKGVVAFNRRENQAYPLELVINPRFGKPFGRSRLPDAAALGRAFAELWVRRLDHPDDVQGFEGEGDIPWGRFSPGAQPDVAPGPAVSPAPPAAPPAPVADSDIVARIRAASDGGKKTLAGVEADQKKERAELREEFVAGAATVWTVMRSRSGFGETLPPWAGAPGAMPTDQRRERTALIQVFEMIGGERAAVAWSVFCGAKPVLTEKGEKKFDPTLPHHQYVGPDKPPRSFAKHLVSIEDEVRRHGSNSSPAARDRLRSVFGRAFAAPSRTTVEITRPVASSNPMRISKADTDGNQAATGTAGGRDTSLAIGAAALQGDG